MLFTYSGSILITVSTDHRLLQAYSTAQTPLTQTYSTTQTSLTQTYSTAQMPLTQEYSTAQKVTAAFATDPIVDLSECEWRTKNNVLWGIRAVNYISYVHV